MISFKQNVTVERQEKSYKIANARLFMTKIIWSVIFGILLIAFLAIAITQDGKWWMYLILAILFVVVVYINFIHDDVVFKFKQKKLALMLEKEEVFIEIDFNSEHVAISSPISKNGKIVRIDYPKLSQVFYDDVGKILFFLMKGDSAFFFTMFLEDEEKNDIKEALEMFDNDIINIDKLEEYLGFKLEREFVEVIDVHDEENNAENKE